MIPAKRLTDPSFRYTSSVDTNLARTFARIRKEQAEAAKVVPITPLLRKVGK